MDFVDIHPLSLIIFLPAVGALLIAVLRQLDEHGIRSIAALFTFASFVLSVILFVLFDTGAGDEVQFVEKVSWIPQIDVQYYLGVDGLNLPMVILTTLLGFIAVLV
ncbi:MAG: NADH-quinone oxidoreductase subunit M, partial [Chloroflexi bacterium]